MTEKFADNDFRLYLCLLTRVFNCLFVWPTYEASQSLHLIL